jgi:hypothetical protein
MAKGKCSGNTHNLIYQTFCIETEKNLLLFHRRLVHRHLFFSFPLFIPGRALSLYSIVPTFLYT